MSKILVTGATGQLGTAVINNLLKHTAASNISALVRNEAKAGDLKAKGVNIVLGNYDDFNSLVAAFEGIDKVYMVSGDDIVARVKQQESLVKAAEAAGVKVLVYTSFQRKNETDSSPIAAVAKGHLNTEKLLKESGLLYTILQHNLYADIIPMFAGKQVLETKTIFLPAGDGKTSFALRTDFAEAGANVLLDETGKYERKVLALSGAEAISFTEIAQIISSVTGTEISYHAPTVAEFTAALTAAGVPAEVIGIVSAFSAAIAEGEVDAVSTDLAEILGRKPVTVAEYLKTVYGKG